MFPAVWLSSALIFPRRSAVGRSGRGPASRRSPLPSVRCWVDGSSSMVRGDGCSSSMFRWGWRSLLLTLWKVPESRADNRSRQFDWFGGLLAVLGFGGIVLGTDRIDAGRGRGGGRRADCAVVLGSALLVADGSARFVPLPQFQRSEPAHPLSLLRVERHAFLFSSRFDTGARLLADGSGSGSAASHSVDVLVVALVWRTSRSLRRQGSAGCGSPDRGRRIRVVCEARYWRVLLDHVLPRSIGAGTRHGDQRRSAHDHRDERGGAKLCGSCLRN